MSLYAEEIQRIKKLLQVMGRSAKKSLGQNFLVNSQKINEILQEVSDQKPAMVVEVGPGLGALTLNLKENFSNLKLIEMDQQFIEYWQEQGCHVIAGDALKVDWQDLQLKNAVLVSNLPYQIAARLVVERSVEPAGIKAMVLMFQKEVAQRMIATHKRGDYGLISVIAQSFWQVRTLSDLGPNDFFPPPKVASRVVLFKEKIVEGREERQEFLEFIRLCFAQRRKMLKKSLLTKVSQNKLEASFEELGISLKARPEEISVESYWQLFRSLK